MRPQSHPLLSPLVYTVSVACKCAIVHTSKSGTEELDSAATSVGRKVPKRSSVNRGAHTDVHEFDEKVVCFASSTYVKGAHRGAHSTIVYYG